MSEDQWKLIQRLSDCTLYAEGWDKKFVKSLIALADQKAELSPKQAYFLLVMGHRYRRQLREIPDPVTGHKVSVVPEPPPYIDGQPAPDVPDLPQQPTLF